MTEKKILLLISFFIFIAFISYYAFMSYTQFVSAQISTLENSTAQDPLSLPDLFTKVENQ